MAVAVNAKCNVSAPSLARGNALNIHAYHRAKDAVLATVPAERRGIARQVFERGVELIDELRSVEGEWTKEGLREHFRLLLSQRVKADGYDPAELAGIIHQAARALCESK